MITWQEILHKYKESEIPAEHLANLKILHQKLNEVRKAYGKPMVPTSVYRTLADHLRIYREMGITDQAKIPMKSKHLSGQAIDISDPDGKLMDWCLANQDVLEKVGLWCEERDDKKRVHFQIVPPKSGRRFFKP
jgi:uncharacterized protein YcbK (DUF882 family)